CTHAYRRQDVQRRCIFPKRDNRCVQGGGQGEKCQVARKPQIRERLRRQDYQTHASRTSEGCCQTGDRCLQGGGEGQKDKVASEPAVRQELDHNGSQRAPDYEHQRSAQSGECKRFAHAPTPGMGMWGDEYILLTAQVSPKILTKEATMIRNRLCLLSFLVLILLAPAAA